MGMLELIICEMLEAYTLSSAEHRSMGFDSLLDWTVNSIDNSVL